MVKDALYGSRFDSSLCDTHIVLIPKVTNPVQLDQLRPISLCNVSYKIITKVLVNRISGIMSKLVGPLQSSFIPGRSITDNVIIASEAIHSFGQKRRSNGWMVIKVDLEKAYDSLSWDFINDTLMDVGLPSFMINIILKSLAGTRARILWNGQPSAPFVPSRGVKQGDPLSPYIFVLCMERLAQTINALVGKSIWKPWQLNHDAPKISHLFFADDMLIFTKASAQQANMVKKVLEDFSLSSGLTVNLLKTKIMFSSNVEASLADEITGILGYQRTSDLGKYLGFNFRGGKSLKYDLNPVLDSVRKKVSD